MVPDSPFVDGITPSGTPQRRDDPASPDGRKKIVGRLKFIVVLFTALPYTAYVLWSLFLLSVLPDATGTWDSLIPTGRLVAMTVGAVMVIVAIFGVMRAGKNAELSDRVRYMSFIRLGLFTLPALILSGIVPYMIVQEPPLVIHMISPPKGTELVAPVSVTFSAEESVMILERRDLKPVTFDWDFNGDGTSDQQTVVPTATAIYERQGTNLVIVTITLSSGGKRTVRMRVVVPNAVFSYTPVLPIVDEPVLFSVAHLIPALQKDVTVRDVQWDFNGDGTPEKSGTDLQATHTFLRTGAQDVSATIIFSNQTQANYIRTISIREPDPLPFPVRIETTPEFLESSPPFQVVFRIETDEPVQDVVWDFGDATKDAGMRVGHTFKNRGVYQVIAEVRNKEGKIAKVTKTVKIVNTLRLLDLTFDGSHQVLADRITAVAPVAVELTPKTSMPLVNFFWEAPGASEIVSTDTKLKATFRLEGTYTLILIGQDAEGAVLRKPITLDIKPQSGTVNFDMKPTQGVAPLTVKFDATETYIPNEEITGFQWTFGDGEDQSQILESARVDHVFTKAGTYTVTLTVFSVAGTSKSTSRTIVVRAPVLDACFVASRSSGPAPLGIHFDRSCSSGTPQSVLWEFGDGAESKETGNGVDHVFEQPGQTFTVKLTLRDENGVVSSVTQKITTDPQQ
ncbi:PKD domain-containing protein [Candidatus Peregrinibacteria bacterium]|nr:PKD domain-containing protein [Candidatus Peregrinibacteria bacterium]